MEKIVKIIAWAQWLEGGVFNTENTDQIYSLLFEGFSDPDLNMFIPSKIEFIGESGSKITFFKDLKPCTLSATMYASWLYFQNTQQPDGQYQASDSDTIHQMFLNGFKDQDSMGWPADRVELSSGDVTLYFDFNQNPPQIDPTDIPDINDWQIIDAYSRREALADGVQVLADPETAKEVGFKIPVYLTETVFKRYVQVPEDLKAYQEEKARLWDLLFMLYHFIRRSGNDMSSLDFQVSVAMSDKTNWLDNETYGHSRFQRLITLHSVIGPIDFDDPAPCITISLPGKD